jgi:serine/threonine protein kinase
MLESENFESLDRTAATDGMSPDGVIALEPDSVVLERYKVIGLLGKGGMGSVYHVQHLHLKSDFALKVLNKQADSNVWRRFDNEAKAASRLDHPNLIKVHDSGLLPDGQPFFIMDLVKGETLADLIKRNGRLPLQETLKIFIQVGFALAYAHDNGVVHRDLKPSNIMIAKTQAGSLIGTVKVVDLGIAKLSGIDEFNQQTLTRTGEIFGSPLYMSPEQCMGIAVDNRSDLYSLGCSMYEALTGAPPMIGESALSTMMKHQADKPLSLKEASLGLQFPKEIEVIISRLLEKDPNHRYSNSHVLTHELVQIEQRLSEFKTNEGGTTMSFGQPIQETITQRTKSLKMEILVIGLLTLGAYLLGFATSVAFSGQQNDQEKKEVNLASDMPHSVIARPNAEENKPESSPDAQEPISEISRDGKTRIFKFPRHSVGTILIDRGQMKEARGTITAPINATVYFRPDPVYLRSPDLLNRFGPNDLTSLVLEDMVQTNPSVLTALPRFKRLTFLKVSMDVGNEAFPYLDRVENLVDLDLAHTHIHGNVFCKLKRLPHLQSFRFAHLVPIRPTLNQLTPAKVTNVKIDDNELTIDDLKYLSTFKNLKLLSVGGNKVINDETLKLLLPLSKLRHLYCVGCTTSAKCIDTIKRFKSLKEIAVSNWSEQDVKLFKRSVKGVKIHAIKSGTLSY